jgi:hypothetical protein
MTTVASNVVRKDNAHYFTALLYDDVEILDTWENDTHVGVLWTRPTQFAVEYQADRLSSGWFFATVGWVPALSRLAEEFGLNIPCVEEARDDVLKPLFSVVGAATYDAATDTLEAR